MIKIAKRYNASAARIALSWLKDKPGITSIIIGAKRKDQLLDNLACTQLQLTQDEIKELDAISALTPEYPGWMVDRQLTGRFPESK